MGIFNTLLSAIFGRDVITPSPQPMTPDSAGKSIGGSEGDNAPFSAVSAISTVDVASKLDGLAAKHHEKLNWKTSIVDLMKLVGVDSSLAARRELAKDLNYTGDTEDTASMNIWLHKQVIQKIAANGGTLPAELAHPSEPSAHL